MHKHNKSRQGNQPVNDFSLRLIRPNQKPGRLKGLDKIYPNLFPEGIFDTPLEEVEDPDFVQYCEQYKDLKNQFLAEFYSGVLTNARAEVIRDLMEGYLVWFQASNLGRWEGE